MAPPSDARSAERATTLGDIAGLLGGTLEGGDPAALISGVARLAEATPRDLSFCAMPRYRALVASTAAAAVVVGGDFEPPPGARDDLPVVRVADPYLAIAAAVSHFHPPAMPRGGIHAAAIVAASARLGDDVAVGAGAVIGERCVIGDASLVGPGCVLADGVRLGASSRLHANVTVYDSVTIGDRVIVHAGAVLGADGFGYAFDGERHRKVPQVGELVIEDDVEIGANACIDRAALGVTRIAAGVKIDNLVQIGHNCEVGAHSVLSGQVGLGGSTIVGEGVLIGGQAGIKGHVEVGDGAMIAAASGVTNSIAAGQIVAGYPHLEASRWRRAMAAVRELPALVRRVRKLERAQHSAKEDE